VKIGDLTVLSTINTNGKVTGYSYSRNGERIQSFRVTEDEFENAKEGLKSAFQEQVNAISTRALTYNRASRSAQDRTYDEHAQRIESIVSEIISDEGFNEPASNYLETANTRINDVNTMTGADEPLYKDVKVIFDDAKFEQDFGQYNEPSKRNKPIRIPNYNKYLTYELVQ
jgi:hypothetical protein